MFRARLLSFPRRTCTASLILCLALSLSACGGGSSTTAATVSPFSVTAVTPGQDATEVAMGAATAVFTLSEEADAASITPAAVTATEDGTPLAVTVDLAPDGRTVTVRTVPTTLGATIRIELLSALLRRSDAAPLERGGLNPLRFVLEEGEVDIPDVGTPQDPGRFEPTATPLLDDRLLVVGGLGKDGAARADALTRLAPAAPVALANTLAQARWAHGAARLSDGRVLIVGGFTDGAGTSATASCEFFDPASDSFAAATSLPAPRAAFQLVPTVDGVPVLVGGLDAFGGVAVTANVEGWDEALGTWSTLDESFPAPVGDVAAAPLSDGNILVAGGVDASGAVQAAAFIVEPADGDVEPVTATLSTARRAAGATRLPDGTILIVGGQAADGSKLASLELFDPVTETFRTVSTATLGAPRSHVKAQVLANGTVAFVGGVLADGSASDLLETYDPATERIISTYTMDSGLNGAAIVSLGDGGLLTIGGATGSTLPPAATPQWRAFSSAALGSNVPAPRVVAWTPASTTADIDVDRKVVVTFSRPIDPATITSASVVFTSEEGKELAGTRTLSPDGLSLTFTPDHPLPVWQRIDGEVKTTVTDALGTQVVDDQARKGWFTTTWDVRIGSPDDGAQFGYSARTGDINNDGIDDLVIAAYVAESTPGSGVKEGQVAVIFGKTTWGPSDAPRYRDLAAATSAADLLITSESHLDQLGVEGALVVADIDQDGFDDILMGAHFADGPSETDSSRGEVWVVFGQATFPQKTLQLGSTPVTGFDMLRIFGAKAGDKLGEGMAVAKIDEDAYPDIVVGATGDDGAAGSSTGAMYVFFGDTKTGLGVSGGYGEDIAGSAATTITNLRVFGEDSNDRLGWSCAAGDIDGDGYAEFVGGATGADGDNDAKSSAGEVILVFGNTRSSLVPSGFFAEYEVGDTALNGIVIHGEDAGDFIGWSSSMGRLDADARTDLAIGGISSDGLANAGDRRGEAVVLFGAPRASLGIGVGTEWRFGNVNDVSLFPRILRIHGGDDKHSVGDAVLLADIDGDNSTDFLIGDFQARGALDKGGSACCWGEISVLRGAGLIPGGGGGLIEFEMSNDGSTHPASVTLTRFYGAAKGDRAGTTLAVGDFNNDGQPDLLTGANKARGLSRLFKDGGEAYILWGRATWWR